MAGHRLVLAVFAAFLAVGLMIQTGCSEARSRAAGAELMRAVEAAQKQVDEALVCMNAPGPQGAESSMVNPATLEILVGAEKELSAAMGAASGADEASRATALSVLSRILSLQGRYHAAVAAAARSDASGGLDLAGKLVFVLQVQNTLTGYHGEPSGTDAQQFERLGSEASGQSAELKARRQGLDEKLQELKKQYTDTLARNETLVAQAREIRRQVPTSEGLDVLEKALEIEQQIDDNSARAAQIERAIKALNANVRELSVALEASQKLLAAIDAALARSRTQAEDHAVRKDELAKAMDQTIRSLASRLAALGVDYRRLDEAVAAAVEAFDRAEKKLADSERLVSTSATRAERGEVHAAMAQLHAADHQLMTETQRFVDALSRAHQQVGRSLPPATRQLGDYARRAPKAKADAAAHYARAEGLYEKAISGAQRQRDAGIWGYQGGLAAAYVGHYRLTGDGEILAGARKLLASITGAGRVEPRLTASVAQLRRMLADEQPPATAPEPAPPAAPQSQPEGPAEAAE